MTDNRVFTFIDLFSGIGGFRVALEDIGCKCIGFSEIEKNAISVYKKNFNTNDELEIGDITKAKKLPKCDILVGGVPCQSWSIAGKMRGFSDPRGKLWLDTVNATKQIMPKAFIFENVKGLADPRNRYNLELIINEFRAIDYDVQYKVLNAFDYGLPQSRERLFIVGIKKSLSTEAYKFPEKYNILPFLSDILDGMNQKVKVSMKNGNSNMNSFNMAAVTNKGNFYIFSDVRNGDHTIHSWDLIETTDKEKMICISMLRNRRKSVYGNRDGNPLSFADIAKITKSTMTNNFVTNYEQVIQQDIDLLVSKKILKKSGEKYEFQNSKISSGINGIYRIYLPESHVFSTLTKSGNRDFVSCLSIPDNVINKKEYFIREILLKKKYRAITIKEAAMIQGFPSQFIFNTPYSVSMGLLGNAVAVNIVKLVAINILKSLRENYEK